MRWEAGTRHGVSDLEPGERDGMQEHVMGLVAWGLGHKMGGRNTSWGEWPGAWDTRWEAGTRHGVSGLGPGAQEGR